MEMKDIERPQGLSTNRQLEWNSDIAAEMLRLLDIPYISMNPGASYRGLEDSLVNYLGNRAPQLLLCLHEDHVVSIAHGYAKATDRPMACVLHSNVGLMHGLMGLFNAWCDRVPMLVLGATGPTEPEKRRPWIDWIHTAKDQGAMLRNFTKWDDEPRSSAGIVEAFLRAAQRTAEVPRAPVYICLDAGLQEKAIDPVAIPDLKRYCAGNPPGATQSELKTIAASIAQARKPVFLFGRGSRRQADWDRRIALAELAGASVMTAFHERAIFPTDHGLHIGPPVRHLNASTREMMLASDLIVSFDWLDLNGLLQKVVSRPDTLPGKVIHVSVDSELHNGWSMDYFGLPPTDVRVKADVDIFVEQLLPELQTQLKGVRRWDGKARAPQEKLNYSEKRAEQIAPSDIEVALAEVRGDQKFTLAHLPLVWSGAAYRFHEPLDYLGHDGGGGLSAGPGLTIGAALALKDSERTVISVLGDGDFLQGATALWTAAHYRIPALFIVSNNRSNYNDEIHQNTIAGLRKRPRENSWIGQRLSDPEVDLATIAKGQGVEGEGPIKTVPALLDAIRRAIDVVRQGRPYFIDAHVTRPPQSETPTGARIGR